MPRPADVGAPVGMNWFRSNIKHGARLALLALAVQFALSFGHFHGTAAQAAPAIQSAAAQPDVSHALAAPEAADESARRPASNHDSDRHPGEDCAICAVTAQASTVLVATPPVLPPPRAIEPVHLTTDAEIIRLNSASEAFQPRAPPAS
jgi:hypothetical protein